MIWQRLLALYRKSWQKPLWACFKWKKKNKKTERQSKVEKKPSRQRKNCYSFLTFFCHHPVCPFIVLHKIYRVIFQRSKYFFMTNQNGSSTVSQCCMIGDIHWHMRCSVLQKIITFLLNLSHRLGL